MKKSYLIMLLLAMSVGCQNEKTSPVSASKPAEKSPAAPAKTTPKEDHSAHGAASTPKQNNGAKSVFFRAPMNQAKVFTTFTVGFGVQGMTVTPAGEAVDDKSRGHHHLIINGKPIPAGQPVPMNETHKHFGKGQTEATVTLPVGQHTLTMQFADGAHISYGESMATSIQVNVVEAKEPPKVFFVAPKDKEKVKSPLSLKFGVQGMTVRPAGEDPLDHTSGHHHLIIDGKAPAYGVPVAKDATHIHYGKGQTEASVDLTPGKHTLTMQFADGAHLSYGPGMSTTIEVEVLP